MKTEPQPHSLLLQERVLCSAAELVVCSTYNRNIEMKDKIAAWQEV